MVETAYKCKEINLSIYLHPFSTCIEFSIRDQDSESYTIKVSLTFIYYLAADRHYLSGTYSDNDEDPIFSHDI